MDRRERQDDPIEAMRAAQDGKQAEIWTSLPGIIESFDPVAITATVQPAIQGQVRNESGASAAVNLPLLVDVPVEFPSGGGFTLTFPVKKGDECVVEFAARCIDAWWAGGGVQPPLEARMHDLSDAICRVGVRSQARKLTPAVHTENVQLRSDDGENFVEITPEGEMTAEAKKEMTFRCPIMNFEVNSISMASLSGGKAAFKLTGDIVQIGSHESTGDQKAGGISQIDHTHRNTQPGSGSSGVPQ